LERATGVRRDDVRSDIYFLGCIYYNMLTGRPPLVETRDRLLRLSKQRFLDVTPVRKLDPSVPACAGLVVTKAMMLDAEGRYQSPAAMLAELRVAAKRLAEGRTEPDENGEAGAEGHAASTGVDAPSTGRAVMIVESDGHMQDIFRKSFKHAGYRVLVTADPGRAAGRFRQDPAVADCVLFSAQQLGRHALDMFNQMGEDKRTDSVPAILLLNESQEPWKSQAHTADHRIVLSMPLTMKQLRTSVEQLLVAESRSGRAKA
jgi:serine/threonine-protein kinase